MQTITIDRESSGPVYRQVADQVRRLIAAGDLSPGVVMPPVRRLAGDLGVNLNTIARAYRLLESEGFLVIRDRSGVTVAEPSLTVGADRREELLAELRATLARLRQAGLSSDANTRRVVRRFLDGAPREEGPDE